MFCACSSECRARKLNKNSCLGKQVFISISTHLADALKACTALVKSSSSRLNVCLPLYKNLIALERAYGRISSAEGICRHLLKDNPSVVVLWLCLAALEDAMKKAGEVEKVYKEALLRCKCHAEVSYSAARYYLGQVRERHSSICGIFGKAF